ncbi:MAG: hypothetical protein GY794_26605 [bacterium]|nr:hypothetical protein [bacterium]
MKHRDLPERWKQKIREYLRSQGVEDRDELNAYDFFTEQVVKIKFEDDSYAELYYPLVIEAPEFNEAGVFTEHCGYHIFSMGGTHISVESCLQ